MKEKPKNILKATPIHSVVQYILLEAKARESVSIYLIVGVTIV